MIDRKKIAAAQPKEIDELLDAVLERKRELYPQWEINYLAIPKGDCQEQKQTLAWMFSVMERQDKGSILVKEVIVDYLTKMEASYVDEMMDVLIKRNIQTVAEREEKGCESLCGYGK